jgi:hypothetical protein
LAQAQASRDAYDFKIISDRGATATVFLAQPRDRPGAKCYVVKRVDKPLRFPASKDYFHNERAALEVCTAVDGNSCCLDRSLPAFDR